VEVRGSWNVAKERGAGWLRNFVLATALATTVVLPGCSTGSLEGAPLPSATTPFAGAGGPVPRPPSPAPGPGVSPTGGSGTAASPPAQYLPATGPSDAELVGEVLGTSIVISGFVAFEPVEVMRAGVTRPLEVRISRAADLTAEVRKDLTQLLSGTGQPEVNPIQTADVMALTLRGPDSHVEPITPEKQGVTTAGITVWQWDVTPLRGGSHRLLTLCASMDVKTFEGYEPSTASCPFQREIRVQVNPVFSTQQFIGRNWRRLLSTSGGLALVGAMGQGLRVFRKRSSQT
jgi:hypothetical protein